MSGQDSQIIPSGTLLAHYRVLNVLGKGGMGTVYRAHDTSLDRPVALKVLRGEIADDPVIVDRFVREARAAARVSHGNLTHIYFVGAIDDRRFFAMEYVPGETLEECVHRQGPLPLDRAVDLLVQAARGLQAAHSVGVVHRDVKPSNLMITPEGIVKVTDFGLAKSSNVNVNATGEGTILGTPAYMSPEQCRGDPVDIRTDVYALGLTAFFALTGHPPFRSEKVGRLLDEQMNRPMPSVDEERPDLPPGVDDVLAALCAKKPDERPADMVEVMRLLETVRPRDVTAASLMARVFAFGVDLASIGLVWVSLAGTMTLVSGVFGEAQGLIHGIVFAGIVLGLQWGVEVATGTTAGKWLLHLEVVRDDGTRAGAMRLLARFFLRLPGAAAFVIGPLLGENVGTPISLAVLVSNAALTVVGFGCALVPGRRTLSDLLTRTRVTYRILAAEVSARTPTPVP